MQSNYDISKNDDKRNIICDSDDSMPSTERELADDAQWKIIQKNTFTRWVNVHLKKANQSINDLQTDFSDGLRLVTLIEVLSEQKFTHINKKTNFRTQKLENVTMVLRFLEHKEGLRLVNIDSSDIVDCRLKLILGLVWALILHYSISMSIWEGEDTSTETKHTPKQRMMSWIHGKIPGKEVKNLTTDWNDGTAIGALVDSCAPGLCPDWQEWKPNNALENTKEAMDTAEQWLNVPQLIKPEEMIDPNVDEKAMMTYLSQFPNAKLKPGAEMLHKPNTNKVRVYGPGIESKDLVIGEQTEFIVDALSAGRGTLEIKITNSNGKQIDVSTKEIPDQNNCFKCVYTPPVKGTYIISVRYADKEIPRSPFKVTIEKTLGDASKVLVYGPGVEQKGVILSKVTSFTISTENAGSGDISCVILNPNAEQNKVIPKIMQITPTLYKVEYTAHEIGIYSINVFFTSQHVSNSPFGVMVSPKGNAKMVMTSGRGIQTNGIRVGDKADVKINTENAGEGKLSVKLITPNRVEEEVKVIEVKPNYFECMYIPSKPGVYELRIDYDDVPVSRSPFKINVLPSKQSCIAAYGSGLSEGVVNKAAIFVTDTNGESGSLGFSIEGPSQAKIECCDNQDGSATICYWPTTPGEYAVHVLCDGEDIPDSPYMANILPSNDKSDVSKIKVYGPGVQKDNIIVNVPIEFTIDCIDYKSDFKPEACCYLGNGDPIPVSVLPSGNHKYRCSYQPPKPGNYKIFVTCDNQSVPKSPFKVKVATPSVPSNVRIIGEGIQSATRYSPAYFSVDTTTAGQGILAVELTDEIGNMLPIKIANETDHDIFDVQFQPNTAGPVYNCDIRYDGVSIPGSPFQIQIKPDVDVSKVFVEKLESRILQESFIRFVVNSKAIDAKCKGTVKAIFTEPNSFKSACMVKNNGDGSYSCSYSPYDAGIYTLEVTYEDLSVKNSPFQIEVVPGCDPSKVLVFGDGLEGGYTNQPNYFTIDLDGAGQGNLGLAIEGPSDAKINCTDNLDGTCTVEYSSSIPGTYDIYIKFNDIDIKGSPFQLKISDPINASNVKYFGEPMKPDSISRIEEPLIFIIDASRAGDAPLKINCKDGEGHEFPIEIKVRENAMPGIYDVSFIPTTLGPHSIEIRHGDTLVPGAPFNFNVLPKYEPEKVRVCGEGVYPSNGFLSPSAPVQFHVDVSKAGHGDLQLNISNPDNLLLPFDITNEGNGIYCCQYVPVDAGKHIISLSFENTPVPNSPFVVDVAPVGNASKCFIEEDIKEYIFLESEMMISVNTAEAGEGKVSCRVLPLTENGDIKSNLSLPVEIENNNNGTQSIYYTPAELGNYLIDIKFGGVSIPNGRFQERAVDPSHVPEKSIQLEKTKPQFSSASKDCLDYPMSMYPVEFRLPISLGTNIIEAIVMTPSGTKESAFVRDNENGTVTILYEPHERGMHEMIVICDNTPIQGSPYRFFAENAGLGKVAAYGPGLSHGQTGLPAEFTIVTKDAGSGGLSLAIEGPSKAEIVCKDNENGSCDVTYNPMIPGDYSIIIKFADHNIPGSPFIAKIIGEPHRRSQICIGSTSDIPLKIQNLDISTLTASVQAPSGKEEPCILKKIPNENLGISFTPKEVGNHFINVYHSGAHILGSPFKIVVGQNEIGDASKVRVYGDGLKSGFSSEMNSFTVDTREAGYGGLSLSIEGPSKAEIECRDNYDGTCKIFYTPNEPGTYMINIKYANEHVLGSPFAVKITGEPSAKLMEKIICRQEAADITQVGSQCELTLKVPGTNPLDMRATVTNLYGVTEVCEIIDLDDGHYSIKFVPKEMGLHTVVVQNKNAHIPGSPFQFTVGPIVDGGTNKVVANGSGLKLGYLNTANEFSIYTREAGAGGLSMAIEGPSKAEIDFEDRKDGSCGVKYFVTEPGEYICSIKFNDEHIINSPFRIIVNEKLADCISVASVGNNAFTKEWTIGRPAAFTVNYSQTQSAQTDGKLKALIVGPSKTEESAIIQNIDKNQYAIRFIPKESGEHLISVLDELTNKHIPGSPFRVFVGSQNADPSMVHVRGEGLSNGLVDRKNTFIVNTVNSGTGALNVTIDGPSKVQLYSQEHDEGYEFIYVPTVPGEYQITIKYGGNYHITGSPFIANITGPVSDESEIHIQQQSNLKVDTTGKFNATVMPATLTSLSHMVHCHGLGIKKANLNQANTFNVDASKAGNDILFVGIAGPKSQCEEVSVKHTGHNHFTINYWVQEKGRHYLMVKWGDRNIPGSPFIVDVL